jgi:hypothetical protein
MLVGEWHLVAYPATASVVWIWPNRCRNFRQPATNEGANVLWAEPHGVPWLEEPETVSPAKRTRVQKGPLAAHSTVELARPSCVEPVASELSGSHRVYPLTERARNPMGACRAKQTDEVPGGENRQEGAKP